MSIPGVVKNDDKLGRYMEANRDINQGEIVIQEDAIITGPSGGTTGQLDPAPFSVCLGCYKLILPGNEIYVCSVCKWPMCDEKCEKIPQHAKFECKVFKNNNVKPTTDPIDYLSIKILRCLQMKEVNAKKYEQLMSLESQQKNRPKIASKEVCEFIHKRCNMKQFDTDMVGRVAGIVSINSFGTTDRITPASTPRMASLLFFNASMLSHSCQPNTSWIRIENPDNTFSIKLWATVNIKSGQHITTQYMDITRATIERRAHLQEIYYFPCNCERCLDPTELGTMYNAVKCDKCPKGKGYLLSSEPAKGADAQWKCNSCGGTQHYRESSGKIETEIVGEIQGADGDETELEKVLAKHEGITVHANHYLMMDLRQEIVKRIFNSLSKIKETDERVKKAKRLLELCKSLQSVTDVFYPGQNRIKARLLFYIKYGEACSNGDGDIADKEMDKIDKILRDGKEMSIFD